MLSTDVIAPPILLILSRSLHVLPCSAYAHKVNTLNQTTQHQTETCSMVHRLQAYTDGVQRLQACAGWQHLIVEESACAHHHATPPHSSIWVGGRGSTTQAHYDVLHNIFVQVRAALRYLS